MIRWAMTVQTAAALSSRRQRYGIEIDLAAGGSSRRGQPPGWKLSFTGVGRMDGISICSPSGTRIAR
jgi:hypothetical protein